MKDFGPKPGYYKSIVEALKRGDVVIAKGLVPPTRLRLIPDKQVRAGKRAIVIHQPDGEVGLINVFSKQQA